MVLVVDRLH